MILTSSGMHLVFVRNNRINGGSFWMQ
jgi:hypothetical protein